jgi:hypothetical protein
MVVDFGHGCPSSSGFSWSSRSACAWASTSRRRIFSSAGHRQMPRPGRAATSRHACSFLLDFRLGGRLLAIA